MEEAKNRKFTTDRGMSTVLASVRVFPVENEHRKMSAGRFPCGLPTPHAHFQPARGTSSPHMRGSSDETQRPEVVERGGGGPTTSLGTPQAFIVNVPDAAGPRTQALAALT